MRRPAVALFLATALLASPSLGAPGLHVSWDHCIADGRVANKSFACDTNTGSDVLVFSYELSDALTDRFGVEATVHVQSSSGVMPDWWFTRSSVPAGCRAGGLGFDVAPGAPSVCADPYQGAASGGIGAYVADDIGPGSWTLKLAMAVPPGSGWTISPGTEYFAFRLVLNRRKTVAGCAGCDVPVCLAFGKAKFTGQLAEEDLTMWAGGTGPRGGDCTATWQGAFVNGYTSIREGVISDYARLDCLHDDSTPARPSTWGAVKALYR